MQVATPASVHSAYSSGYSHPHMAQPQQQQQQTVPAGAPAPIELEHTVGFNTRCAGGLGVHPTASPLEVVYSSGRLVVIGNAEDPHQQAILRGHDAFVSCVAVSPSGRYIASGQQQSLRQKGQLGSIVIWDYQSRVAVQHMRGHKGGCLSVAFSPDERWLASTGEDGATLLWEVQTGELAGGVRDAADSEKSSGVVWGTIDQPGTRNQSYHFYSLYNTGVRACQWTFDIKTMQHRLSQQTCHVPGSGGRLGGFVRRYTCGVLIGTLLVCGTASSDVVVFSTESLHYITSFNVGGGGVGALVALPGSPTAVVGSGDGKLTKIRSTGSGREWTAEVEVQLSGGVCMAAVNPSGGDLLAATSTGVMFRALARDLTATVLMETHVAGITDVAFPRNRSDIFATVAAAAVPGMSQHDAQQTATQARQSGFRTHNAAVASDAPTERHPVKVWSLSDYSVICRISAPAKDDPQSLCFTAAPDVLLVGCASGGICAFSIAAAEGRLLWQIPAAHRGPVSSLTATEQYICSAGEDAVVRVWHLGTREAVATMQHHTRRVTGVLPDLTAASILHTCSLDKTIMTFDLAQTDGQPNSKAPKRLTYKSDPEGAGFTAISQRRTGERELVAVTTDGTVQFYDIDYAQAVLTLRDAAKVQANSVAVHPTAQVFVVAQQDGGVTVYSMATDRPTASPLSQAECHSTSATKAVWSTDGRQIVSVGSDGDICVWNCFI